MRKFILNTSVLSAVASGWGVVQTTRHGPRDWKTGHCATTLNSRARVGQYAHARLRRVRALL